MKLMVFKDSSLWRRYRNDLIDNTNQNLFTCKNIGILSTCSDNPSFEHLRGYQFDEVLWVGYEDRYDVGFKAPMELLAQTHGAKYHYCKPSESKKAPSKPSYGISLPKGSSVDFKTLQPSSETDELVDVMRYYYQEIVKVEYREDDE